ncbi:AAEL004343-PA [Aedes aegypti]|uniref:AAEL004343-PA n=2 Tax=Aedes aegypti TaxID=7159 RepID=A0A1S4F7M7_AEDAE|nr:uncharacterized protein LOC5564585 [Aedes aegypti]EAT44284.1 AAEL004343-PA [Aedes aegypti]
MLKAMTSNRCWIAVAIVCLMGVAAQAGPDFRTKREQYDHSKQMCGKILRTPAADLEHYLRSDYPESHDTACFIRCVSILNGGYDDETGVNMGVLFETYGGSLTKEEYADEAKECLALRDEVECYCMKAYKPILCLKEQFKKRNVL